MNNITKYFSELFMLKRQKRSGFKLAGVSDALCDTLGEHELITAKIAYILAHMEGADPEKCAVMALFHDDGEIRVGDQHKVGARYFKLNEAEKEALKEQASSYLKYVQEEAIPNKILLNDICYSVAVHRAHHSHRVAITSFTYDDLKENNEIGEENETDSQETDR